jgi:hypothetical protein
MIKLFGIVGLLISEAITLAFSQLFNIMGHNIDISSGPFADITMVVVLTATLAAILFSIYANDGSKWYCGAIGLVFVIINIF